MDALEKIKNKYKDSENKNIESSILSVEEDIKNNPSSIIDPSKKLIDKVDELIDGVETDKKLNSWRDSESIILLSEYLKENEKNGISLIEKEGCVTLHFEPGLTLKEKDRFKIAEQALMLLEEAVDDIHYLRSINKFQLKVI